MCHIPSDWTDVASIRQVPDHQECWLDAQERLLVIEILAYQEDVADADAAKYFYDDLAAANGITSNDQISFAACEPDVPIGGLPHNATVRFGRGFQRAVLGREFDIAGYRREQEIRWIQIELCVLRLPSVQTDLLVTLSTPAESNPQDISSASPARSSQLFASVLSTFQIRNWALFG